MDSSYNVNQQAAFNRGVREFSGGYAYPLAAAYGSNNMKNNAYLAGFDYAKKCKEGKLPLVQGWLFNGS